MATTETEDATEPQRPMTAGSTSRTALRKIKEELKCSVCLDMLTDPRLLPCHHSFCLRCLQGIQQHSPWIIRCPNCTEEFGIRGRVSELPRDFRANSLLDCLPGIQPESNNPVVFRANSLLDCLPAIQPESNNIVVSQPALSSSETFLERVTCRICSNIYDEPRKLECGHTFCTECLEFMEPLNGAIIHCPTCEGPTDVSRGVRDLPLDRAKVEYIEAISERVQEEDMVEPIPPISPTTPSSLLLSRSVQPARISSSQYVQSEPQAPVRHRVEVQILNPERQGSSRQGSEGSVSQSATTRQPVSGNADDRPTPRRWTGPGNDNNQSTPRRHSRSENAVNQSTPRRQDGSGNAGNQSTPNRPPGLRNTESQSAPGRQARSENQSTPRRQPRAENDNNQSTPRRQPRMDNDDNQSTPRRYRGSPNQTARRIHNTGSQSGSRNYQEAVSESQQGPGNSEGQATVSIQNRRSPSRNQRLGNPDSGSASDGNQWSGNSGSQSARIDFHRGNDYDGQTASSFRSDTPDTPMRRHYRSEEADGESLFDTYRRTSEDIELPLPSRTSWQMPTVTTGFVNYHVSPLSRFIQNGYQMPNHRMPTELDSDDSHSPSESPTGAFAGSTYAPLEALRPGNRHRHSIARLMAGVMAQQRINDYRARFFGPRFHDGQSPRLSSERPVYENPYSDIFWRH